MPSSSSSAPSSHADGDNKTIEAVSVAEVPRHHPVPTSSTSDSGSVEMHDINLVRTTSRGSSGRLLPPTDRGKRAWLVVVSGFIQSWVGFGLLNSWGIFQAKYQTLPWGQQTSLSNVTWIGSLQPGILFALGSFVGLLSDKVRAGILIKIGIILFAISFVFLAEYGDSFSIFLGLQGILFSVANTLLYYPVVSVATDWFERKRGLALGIISSGSSIGGIFWPIVIGRLDEVWGMDRALLGVALIPLIPLIIASFMVKERAGEDKVNFRRLSRGSVVVIEGRRPSTSEATISLLKTVAQKRFLVLSGALFFVYGGFLLPFNYVPMFAEFNGYGNMSDILLAICYSGSFVGRISTGALADRFGSFNVLCAMSFITGTLTLCWIVMRSLAGMIVFALLFGFSSGGLIPLGSVCVADMTPPAYMEHIGFRLGFMMMLCSVSSVGSGPLCSMTMFGSIILLGTGVITSIRDRRIRRHSLA